ncbi:sulfotransferase domain-containing protein [Thalassotalea sp. SU-HH00458]|uniref:sulfotransferase domain-containing protein n=1 Tax=Thalassotalea sp. SU-HH00458 TaxID=3127657 RepID=UPI0033653613
MSLLFSNKNINIERTIIVISFPRSGSSWIGSILGAADETLYLREPVTTPYLLEKRVRVSVFDPEITTDHNQYYCHINKALKGNAPKLSSIYAYPKKWKKSNKGKTLIIKEVNPLVINEFQKTENKIIYLLRHPYSIAKSYSALHWKKTDLFTSKFQMSELQLIQTLCPTILNENFYFQMGYLQGWIEAKSKVTLDLQSIIIRYEDLCKAPQNSFEQLFKQLNIHYNETIKNKISQSLSADSNTAVGEFSLQRNKESVAYVKVKKADEDNYIEVMKAYSQAIADNNKQNNTEITSAYMVNCSLIKWID